MAALVQAVCGQERLRFSGAVLFAPFFGELANHDWFD
jgi:hypothetical protein